MKTAFKKSLIFSIVLLVVFIVYTICVMKVDVEPLGLEGTDIGFALINVPMRDLIGLNEGWYFLTKIISVLSFGVIGFFACIGLYQVIKNKSLLKADPDIYALGVFYIIVLAVYVLFDKVVINYRPFDLGEGLEASYPSSHTILAITVFVTAAVEFAIRVRQNDTLRKVLVAVCIILAVLMIVGRMLSGVHWFTDIIGGIVCSAFLVSVFMTALLKIFERRKK